MAGVAGLEPARDGIKIRCLTDLAIPQGLLERVKGIEPSLSAWKAEVLPLNYTRRYLVEGRGFEPLKSMTTDLQSAPFGQLGNPSILYVCDS